MFDKNHLNFAFPLFSTSTHMLVQFALSALVLLFVPSLRPKAAHNSDGGRSRHDTEPNGSIMSKMFYLTRIGPCGVATSLDVGLGNTSLKFISLTFYSKLHIYTILNALPEEPGFFDLTLGLQPCANPHHLPLSCSSLSFFDWKRPHGA